MLVLYWGRFFYTRPPTYMVFLDLDRSMDSMMNVYASTVQWTYGDIVQTSLTIWGLYSTTVEQVWFWFVCQMQDQNVASCSSHHQGFLCLYCCVTFFSFMLPLDSLSALIDNRIFSVHGGLSPSITTVDQVGHLTEVSGKLLVLYFLRAKVVHVFLNSKFSSTVSL